MRLQSDSVDLFTLAVSNRLRNIEITSQIAKLDVIDIRVGSNYRRIRKRQREPMVDEGNDQRQMGLIESTANDREAL